MSVSDYLNSLPSDTTEIDISNRGLDAMPDLSRFTNLHTLNCSDNNLLTLVGLPNSINTIYCTGNKSLQITQLPTNNVTLYCHRYQLTDGITIKRIIISA
jgi:Leucine-rich repeat (LRR) protein